MVNIVPKVFPDKPTSYIDIECVTKSKTFVAPEDGWFRFILCGAGGSGGGYPSSGATIYGGGGGGSGGIAVSVFSLNKGDSILCDFGRVAYPEVSVTYGEKKAVAEPGQDGEEGKITAESFTANGGRGGSARGGNLKNLNGKSGENGYRWTSNGGVLDTKGNGGSIFFDGKSSRGGNGHGSYGPQTIAKPATLGTTAKIFIQRGSTNLTQAQRNALDTTSTMLELNQLAQEQTGLLLQ